MAEVVDIRVNLSLDGAGVAGMRESLSSFANALHSLPEIGQEIVDLAIGFLEAVETDGGNLVTIRTSSTGLFLEPSDRYLKFMAAMAARDVNLDVVQHRSGHGWPILSVVAATPIVAGRGGVASLSPERA